MPDGTIKRFNQGDTVQRIDNHQYKGVVVARFRSWEDGEMYCLVRNFIGEGKWTCKEDYLEAIQVPWRQQNARTAF